MPLFIIIKVPGNVSLCVSRSISLPAKNISYILELGGLFFWRAQGLDTKSVNLGQ